MQWLYAAYIKPQTQAAPAGDYSFHLELVENELSPHALESYEKALELTAIQAFLLGLRTGAGLSALTPR